MNQNVNSSKNIVLLIIISILFLALNSILCKAALLNNNIDAYSFTFFRIFSAMIMLLILFYYKHRKITFYTNKNWVTSFMLFLYAITFSYAYLDIDAGFGTLLLFGIVQVVMVISSLLYKEKLTIVKLFGIMISLFGLIYMLYPQEAFKVSLFHSFLMVVSGFSWAIYTVLGKNSKNALKNTTDNFIKASIFITLFYFVFSFEPIHFNTQGLMLAIISGSITSALGYIIWYEVLPNIKIITASVVQTCIPIVAIFLSAIYLEEELSLNLLLSTLIIISGILITMFSKQKMPKISK